MTLEDLRPHEVGNEQTWADYSKTPASTLDGIGPWFQIDGEVTGGKYHIGPGGCGALSDTVAIGHCEELSYCDLWDANGENAVDNIRAGNHSVAQPHACNHQWDQTNKVYTNKPY